MWCATAPGCFSCLSPPLPQLLLLLFNFWLLNLLLSESSELSSEQCVLEAIGFHGSVDLFVEIVYIQCSGISIGKGLEFIPGTNAFEKKSTFSLVLLSQRIYLFIFYLQLTMWTLIRDSKSHGANRKLRKKNYKWALSIIEENHLVYMLIRSKVERDLCYYKWDDESN